MKLDDRNLYWITNYLDYLVVGIWSSCANVQRSKLIYWRVDSNSRNLKCFVNWTNREFQPNNIFLIHFCGTARERPSFVIGSISGGNMVLFSLLTLSEHFKQEKLFQSFNNRLFFRTAANGQKCKKLQFVIDPFYEKNVSKYFPFNKMWLFLSFYRKFPSANVQ